MKIASALIYIAFLAIPACSQKYKCLPLDIKEDTAVSFRRITSHTGVQTNEAITVRQTLKALKARCVGGKLIDRKGKEIRFYQMKGCWGNPPPDYLEIMEKQRTDLEALRKKYTVIEITCSSGSPQRIS